IPGFVFRLMLTARVPNDVINMVVVVTAAPVLIVLSGVTGAALWHWGVNSSTSNIAWCNKN
ncbi:hypothetical protein PoB_002541700, partial [Plakobranchus ocellatus]